MEGKRRHVRYYLQSGKRTMPGGKRSRSNEKAPYRKRWGVGQDARRRRKKKQIIPEEMGVT